MEIYIILNELIKNPHNFNYYKNLIKIYEERNDSNAVEALHYLINSKFKDVIDNNTFGKE